MRDLVRSRGLGDVYKRQVQDLAETVFAHPTISESIKEAAEDALAMGLHLPPRKVLQIVANVQ